MLEAGEMATVERIEETVTDILREADMDLMTEFKLRLAASAKLGFDLSGTNHKKLVRDVLEAFLLSNPGDGEVSVQETVAPATKRRAPEHQRFIYKFSDTKNLTVGKFQGRPFMSIGKETIYRYRGMHFPLYQWHLIKKNFEAVEEAIKYFHSKPRSESAKKGDTSEAVDNINTGVLVPFETSHFDGKSLLPKHGETSESLDNNSTGAFVPVETSSIDGNSLLPKSGDTSEAVDNNSTDFFVPIETSRLHGTSLSAKNGDTSEAVDNNSSGIFVPIENSRFDGKCLSANTGDNSEAVGNDNAGAFIPIQTSRFDGKSYLCWASQMELFLKQLNLSYVLSEPCPGTTSSQGPETNRRKITQADAAGKNWLKDDYLCHNHLLNSLSDHLHGRYQKKFKHAKELWDELKWVYQCEESHSKRSQVRKYIEFNMVEERSILEQVQDFNKIAESIVSAGMFLDETFHVSTIISKFPSSWRGFCTRLVEEEFLPVWMLMERVKAEEEYRRNGAQGVTYKPATGSFQMERRPSLRTTHRGSQSKGWKRKEPGRDGSVIIVRDNCERDGHLGKNCWGKKPDERAFRKPNQVTSSVTAPVVPETRATTNNDKE